MLPLHPVVLLARETVAFLRDEVANVRVVTPETPVVHVAGRHFFVTGGGETIPHIERPGRIMCSATELLPLSVFVDLAAESPVIQFARYTDAISPEHQQRRTVKPSTYNEGQGTGTLVLTAVGPAYVGVHTAFEPIGEPPYYNLWLNEDKDRAPGEPPEGATVIREASPEAAERNALYAERAERSKETALERYRAEANDRSARVRSTMSGRRSPKENAERKEKVEASEKRRALDRHNAATVRGEIPPDADPPVQVDLFGNPI